MKLSGIFFFYWKHHKRYTLIAEFDSFFIKFDFLVTITGEFCTFPLSALTNRALHIIEQHGDRGAQRHALNDLFRANVFIVFILHIDGQKLLRGPGHLLGLRCQHTDAVDVFLEGELFPPGKHGMDLLFVTAVVVGLGNEEVIDLRSRFCDEHSDVSFAVVAHLARRADVPHFLPSDLTGVIGQDCRKETVMLCAMLWI